MASGVKAAGDGTEEDSAEKLEPGHSATQLKRVATPASMTVLIVGSMDDLTMRSEQ
jgi:hypothetical protein